MKAPSDPAVDLITVGPASRLLNITPQALALRVKRGKVPYFPIGGVRFFRRELIEEMAAEEAVAR